MWVWNPKILKTLGGELWVLRLPIKKVISQKILGLVTVGMDYPGFEVEGDQKILKGLYCISIILDFYAK